VSGEQTLTPTLSREREKRFSRKNRGCIPIKCGIRNPKRKNKPPVLPEKDRRFDRVACRLY